MRALMVLCLAMAAAAPAAAAGEKPVRWNLDTQQLHWVIGADGRNVAFAARATGRDYLSAQGPCARIRQGGREIPASAASLRDGVLTLSFGGSGVKATVQVARGDGYLGLKVLAVEGDGVDELVFPDVPLTLKGDPGEPFAACALALNLQTNVVELPGPMPRLQAHAYKRFGLAGAETAVVGCPTAAMRGILQKVVTAAPALPKSSIGGPWALGQPINQGSYLFNFGGMSEQTVGQWTDLAGRLGMRQIDFHGGSSFRFGDCMPNPETYPRGQASLKAVIDRLHEAGIKAGLHTYAFFIDKRCPWVTPVPDPRLAKDAAFTLAQDLPADAAAVPVEEPTQAMSTTTAFFVRNSVTLQVDDELITYSGISKEPPYAFTGCTRGACGTKVAAHARGAKVHHLKESFGLFVPDPETTLFEEVAAKTADTFNNCGFDMISLDALDGEDILGGADAGWHYGSRFVYEIWKRLKRPALQEMSAFHHHLWCVRSRMGAWDHPTRSHKAFIDIHVRANRDNQRMYLPGELGWWAVKTWSGAQGEPTFADDIEYLLCKCIGTDVGFALMGIDPATYPTIPALPRLAAIIKRYEDLRLSGKVPPAMRARLALPNAEYTLEGDAAHGWRFLPVQRQRQRVEGLDGWSDAWTVQSPHAAQPLRVRIEALMSAAAHDSPEGLVVAQSALPDEYADRAAAAGVTADLQPSAERTPAGEPALLVSATNRSAAARGAWAKFEKAFAQPLDLGARQALGVWVRGDGKGEVLNFQLRCPPHLAAGIGDHYVKVDFTGWRYFRLIEPEGARYADYGWPYGDPYSIYRESVNFGQVSSLSVWVNNVPAGGSVACAVGAVRALPLAPARIVNPSLAVGARTVTFPVTMESGAYLEYDAAGPARLYGPQGEPLREVTPSGDVPLLARGRNAVRFACEPGSGPAPRAYVTSATRGEPLK